MTHRVMIDGPCMVVTMDDAGGAPIDNTRQQYAGEGEGESQPKREPTGTETYVPFFRRRGDDRESFEEDTGENG